MYSTSLVNLDAKSKGIDSVWQVVKNLSVDEKAELIERLLDKESEMILVSASSHLADYIIAQTNLLSLEGLAYVWSEVGEQIAAEIDYFLG